MASPIRKLVQLVLDKAAARKMQAETKRSLSGVQKGVELLKTAVLRLGATFAAAFSIRAIARFINNLEEARRTLIRLTGATGGGLRQLEKDTRAIYRVVPESIGEVAIAVGNLNTLLGVVGPQLQFITKAALDFARANEVDVATSAQTVGQLLNRYGLSANAAVPLMDRLTVAGQKTGVSVTDLAERLKESGPVLSALGFSINEQIGLFAEFERRGIRGQEAAAGLNRVFTNLAKEGLTDGAEAFRVFLERIKDAPSDLEAGAIAAEAFGQRAGAKMALDIRAGVFQIDDLVRALEEADGKLAETERASRTTADAFKTQWHDLADNFLPVLLGVRDAVVGLGTAVLWLVNTPLKGWKLITDELVISYYKLERAVLKASGWLDKKLGVAVEETNRRIEYLNELISSLELELGQKIVGGTGAPPPVPETAPFSARPPAAPGEKPGEDEEDKQTNLEKEIDLWRQFGPAMLYVNQRAREHAEYVEKMKNAWANLNGPMEMSAKNAANLAEQIKRAGEAGEISEGQIQAMAQIADAAGTVVAGLFGGNIGQLAAWKAEQNAIMAAEELALAAAVAWIPGFQGSAAVHLAAAAQFTAISASWAALAGATGGFKKGGGRGGGGGIGAAGSPRDVGGGAAGAAVPGAEVHIYFVGPGFDATNPEVQRVVYGASKYATERFGENANVKTHRRPR